VQISNGDDNRGDSRHLAVTAIVVAIIGIVASAANTWATIVNNIVTRENTDATIKATRRGRGRGGSGRTPSNNR
jgi:hypothetical protein